MSRTHLLTTGSNSSVIAGSKLNHPGTAFPQAGTGPVLHSQVTATWLTARFSAAWGSSLSCQTASSGSCSTHGTHLQLAAAWASSGVWTLLLKSASLRLGAPTAPHTWMSDNVTQPSVSIDSNDYFQVAWQAEDELAAVHLASVRAHQRRVRTKWRWSWLNIRWNLLLQKRLL